MSQLEIRPRFQRSSRFSKEEVLARIREQLDGAGQSVCGLVVDQHVTLKVPVEARHFWSPQLSLEIEEVEEGGGSLIRGLYGPAPSVWLMFVFFYALLGFVSMIVAIIGFSEWSLGLPGRILWLLPVAAFIVLMIYLSARAGQKLGHEQMYDLRDFLDEALLETRSEQAATP